VVYRGTSEETKPTYFLTSKKPWKAWPLWMNQDPYTFVNTWNIQYNPQQPQIYNFHWNIPQ
jgi:hypothetical protein